MQRQRQQQRRRPLCCASCCPTNVAYGDGAYGDDDVGDGDYSDDAFSSFYLPSLSHYYIMILTLEVFVAKVERLKK